MSVQVIYNFSWKCLDWMMKNQIFCHKVSILTNIWTKKISRASVFNQKKTTHEMRSFLIPTVNTVMKTTNTLKKIARLNFKLMRKRLAKTISNIEKEKDHFLNWLKLNQITILYRLFPTTMNFKMSTMNYLKTKKIKLLARKASLLKNRSINCTLLI